MTKHSIVLATALLIGLATTSSPALAAQPEPTLATTESGELTVTLDLDIEVSDPALESELRQAMSTDFAARCEQQELTSVSEGGDLTLHVHVWAPEPNALVIDAQIEYQGDTLDTRDGQVCMGCSSEDVASTGLSLLAAGVDHARAERARATPPAPVLEPAPAPEPTPTPPRRRRVLGPAGYVGIVASGVGLGTGIAGALLLYRGNAVHGDPGIPLVTSTDYRPAGVALIGSGVGMMVLGNVLLGVDLGILRDRRDQRRDDHAELAGVRVWARDGAGLAVHGRF